MISIIQDKSAIETDEEFNARINRSADIPKIIREMDARRDNRIKGIAARRYNEIVSEISRLSLSKSDPNRLRFLEKARDSFGLYLSSEEDVGEADQNDSPAYYILLHFLEDGEKISYIGIDETGKVTFRIDGSGLARATVFLADKFKPLLQMKHSRKDIEAMLDFLIKSDQYIVFRCPTT